MSFYGLSRYAICIIRLACWIPLLKLPYRFTARRRINTTQICILSNLRRQNLKALSLRITSHQSSTSYLIKRPNRHARIMRDVLLLLLLLLTIFIIAYFPKIIKFILLFPSLIRIPLRPKKRLSFIILFNINRLQQTLPIRFICHI